MQCAVMRRHASRGEKQVRPSSSRFIGHFGIEEALNFIGRGSTPSNPFHSGRGEAVVRHSLQTTANRVRRWRRRFHTGASGHQTLSWELRQDEKSAARSSGSQTGSAHALSGLSTFLIDASTH